MLRLIRLALPLALAGVTLAACNTAQRDAVARDAARSTVARLLVERYPGVPLQGALNCVIDNASSTEIYTLGADTVTGPTASTAQITATILQRPATLDCLRRDGLPALMRQEI